jgi:hypothetical protein
MIIPFQYTGRSGIVNGLGQGSVAFATNQLREPAFFRGTLRDPVLLREGLAALYQVVVSDFKYRPRDRLEFRAWLEEQDKKFLAGLGMKSQKARQRLDELHARLAELDHLRLQRLKPFHKARLEFFNYVYEDEYELSYLLDPVVTVHPDEVSFEAFSRDESSYGRLAAKHDLYEKIEAFECGTTNIDFSAKLHHEMERMRSYRRTRFAVAAEGFTVATEGSAAHHEKKIDLPESWVMGFLQVHSTMGLALTHFTMSPVELYNICRYLRRHRTRVSPRALRFELEPGKRVRAILEPWEISFELGAIPNYQGIKPLSIRTWGRDRLQVLARLIPMARKIDVYLAGYGMPSIYVVDLGPLTFTLALSGWTDNDWTGGAKFELLTRRLEVSAAELTDTYAALRQVRYGTDSGIAQSAGLDVEKSRSALSHLCQIGRAMFDLRDHVYRHRELFPTPFTVEEAVKAVEKAIEEGDPEAKAGRQIFEQDQVRIIARRPVTTGFKLSGSAKGDDNHRVRPLLHADHESKIIEASCTCEFYRKHKLTRGPCQHVLALRLAHMARLAKEKKQP